MDSKNDIRKISVGPDYKSSMNYLVGQQVLNGCYTIHLIQFDPDSQSIKIWIEKENEIKLWKEFSNTVPIVIEYNIDFD